jgi:hypothetical protein
MLDCHPFGPAKLPNDGRRFIDGAIVDDYDFAVVSMRSRTLDRSETAA